MAQSEVEMSDIDRYEHGVMSDEGYVSPIANGYSSSSESKIEATKEEAIPDCEGKSREKWFKLEVIAIDDEGREFAEAMILNIDPNDCIDEEGRLGMDFIGIVFMKILLPIGNQHLKQQLRRWSVKKVLYEGVSMFDHGRKHRQKQLKDEQCRRPRIGVWKYTTYSRIPPPQKLRKKDIVIKDESIRHISQLDCCYRRCAQVMDRKKVLAVRNEMYKSDFKCAAAMKLDVHRRIHICPVTKKKIVTVEGEEVCLRGSMLIHDVKERTFYRHGKKVKENERVQPHGNYGMKKQRQAIIQARATLQVLLEGKADQYPHTYRSLYGVRVGEKVLPTGTKWNTYQSSVNEVNEAIQLPSVSASSFSAMRKKHFADFTIKRRGDSFARCGTCDYLKKLRSSHPFGSEEYLKLHKRFMKHLEAQEAAIHYYYCSRAIAIARPTEVCSIMHDKIDHSKTASPCLAKRNKEIDGLMKLPMSVTGMLAHGHGDKKYAHYTLDQFPANSNHTIGSIAKLLRDLECEPAQSSRSLFSGSGSKKLYDAVLKGKEMCYSSLQPIAPICEEPKKLPPVLHVQLDNCWKDNKSRYVKCFWSLLVAKGIFKEVQVSFMLVGHTHDDIDASFGRWSQKLREEDNLTVPALMKSYMDLDEDPVIPHLIEEVPDFKAFIEEYIPTEKDKILQGHSKGRQFKFFMRDDGWPVMQYKLSCTSNAWLPVEGIKLWKQDAEGKPLLPQGTPLAVKPRKMKHQSEVVKGIFGYIQYFKRLATENVAPEFERKLDDLISYWEGVRHAIEHEAEVEDGITALMNGFWPETRQEYSLGAIYQRDGTVREEFDEDPHYIGPLRDRPHPSFRVALDTRKGFMVFFRPPDEGENTKPIWLGKALTDPDFDPVSEHFRQIQIQWYIPRRKVIDEVAKYQGWDTDSEFKWKPDEQYSNPEWVSTDAICTAWKPRNLSTDIVKPPLKQKIITLNNLRRCEEINRY